MHALDFDLGFAGVFCFDLDCTEPAKHHCQVCTMPTIALTPTNIGLLNPKEPTTIWSRQIEIAANFTCLKNQLLKLPPKRTTHQNYQLKEYSTKPNINEIGNPPHLVFVF